MDDLSQQKPLSEWKTVLTLFFITSMIESFVMSHVFSFLPVYLTDMHTQNAKLWVGILNASIFVLGLPLVPLWGIWANRYSGKAVVIRSAWVEAIVFVVLGLSHALPGVILAMSLIGFQLGNTGVMLAAIRRMAPTNKIGFSVSLFSVSSPVGMALGPLIGGWVVAHTGLSLHQLYLFDALLSLLSGLMLVALYREMKPVSSAQLPLEPAWVAAWKSVRTTFRLRITWGLFGVYTLLMLARQMVNPYLPVAIVEYNPNPSQTTLVIGVLMGIAALAGALITVVAGRFGDRVGFPRVLAAAFAANAVFVVLLGVTHNLVWFGIWVAGYSAATGIGGAMVFALLSTRIPDTHRTTALNLVYLPLYFGGIVGPILSSGLSRFGLLTQFASAGVLFVLGFVVVLLGLRPSAMEGNVAV